MTAAAPTKFRFDLDLGHREERNSVLTESALATLVSTARAEGYRDGVADGETKIAERLARAAEQLADHAAALNAALDDHRHATLSDAVGLATTIGKKLAGGLIAAVPTAEIDKLLGECLTSLDAVPHLVIRCAPDLADAVREIALARIAASGFAGRLVVLGDPDQANGDARIEWVDGGVARNQATLEAEIDRRVAAFLATRRSLPTAPIPEESQP